MRSFMRVFSVFVFCVFVEANEVSFKAEPLRVGSLLQLGIQSDLRFYGINDKASVRHTLEVFVLEVSDGALKKVKIAYGACDSSGTVPGFGSNRVPVDGKVYLAEREGGRIKVTDATSSEVPEDERLIVERDLEYLGRPHPIATMLNGQKLNLGDKLGQKDVLRQVLEDRLVDYKIGKIKSVDAVLISIGEYNKEKTATFAFQVETGECTAAYDSKLRLTGQLVVAVPSGRLVAVKLDGPVSAEISKDSSRNDLRGRTIRGLFSFSVISLTLMGEQEKRQYTGDGDWGVIIGPAGTRRIGR